MCRAPAQELPYRLLCAIGRLLHNKVPFLKQGTEYCIAQSGLCSSQEVGFFSSFFLVVPFWFFLLLSLPLWLKGSKSCTLYAAFFISQESSVPVQKANKHFKCLTIPNLYGHINRLKKCVKKCEWSVKFSRPTV